MSASPIPAHVSLPTDAPLGAAAAWSWNVVHRNAPGAISAMAFIVAPVSPRDGLTLGGSVAVGTTASFKDGFPGPEPWVRYGQSSTFPPGAWTRRPSGSAIRRAEWRAGSFGRCGRGPVPGAPW